MSVLSNQMILELPVKITLKHLCELLEKELTTEELLLMFEELDDYIDNNEFTKAAADLFMKKRNRRNYIIIKGKNEKI